MVLYLWLVVYVFRVFILKVSSVSYNMFIILNCIHRWFSRCELDCTYNALIKYTLAHCNNTNQTTQPQQVSCAFSCFAFAVFPADLAAAYPQQCNQQRNIPCTLLWACSAIHYWIAFEFKSYMSNYTLYSYCSYGTHDYRIHERKIIYLTFVIRMTNVRFGWSLQLWFSCI